MTQSHSHFSWFRRIAFGMGLAAAVAWVLLRQRRIALPANEDLTCTPPKTPPEIDITPATPSTQEGDALERIRGIGPVFARRLREAGVQTFADLAACPPERLREIVQAQPWHNPEDWIAQALQLQEGA